MMELAIKIDNRLYEYQRDKKSQSHFNQNYKRNEGRCRQAKTESYGDPMELDATIRGKPFKEEMDRRRNEKLCFECGLPGHRAAIHRQKKQVRFNPNKKTWEGKRQLNATFVPQLCVLSCVDLGSEEQLEGDQSEDESLSWVNREPSVEEHWTIRYIDEWNRRIWSFGETGEGTISEDISVEGAKEGEVYEVKIINEYRILWYGVTTYSSFIERTSNYHLRIPYQEEIWEVIYLHYDVKHSTRQIHVIRNVGDEHQVQAQAIWPSPRVGHLLEVIEGHPLATKWRNLLDDEVLMGLKAAMDPREHNTIFENNEMHDDYPFGQLNPFGQLKLIDQKIDQIDQIDPTNKIVQIVQKDQSDQEQQLNATGHSGQINQEVMINGHRLRAMIDSGATGNFIA
ncbi:hypothetical protein OCU04_004416 [Sclerotinia nivalis]|uniref:Uncharacterized protein n=1 Tax=Sclerotinia nivalis TaxID=352851 RepID=A0A9X0DKL0_9HELO|nr:hypothetical protein OCU04_004416 [Sclerotinia nivalis]